MEIEPEDFIEDDIYCPNCGSCGESLCCGHCCKLCGLYEEECAELKESSILGMRGKKIYFIEYPKEEE